MRLIIPILISIFVFTGCSKINTLPTPIAQKTKKDKNSLIAKANTGDVQAMIELNKIYLFPQTKEGFELYKKWYKIVLQSNQAKDIMAFAKVYNKYQYMFINGKRKYENLLLRASTFKDPPILFEILDYYLRSHIKFKQIKNIEKTILDTNDEKLIHELYYIYMKKQRDELAINIEKVLKEKKMKIPTLRKYLDLKQMYGIAKYEEDINKTLDQIHKSDDYKLVKLTADFFYRRDKEIYMTLLNRAVKLNDKDVKSYRILAKKDIWSTVKNTEERIKNLKKASLLDDYYSTKDLLEIYLSDKKYKDEYLALKEKLLKLDESKRALANFIHKNINKDQGNLLLEELVYEKGNINALIDLATRTIHYGGRYYKLKEEVITKKWQKYIFESDNPSLISKLKYKILKSPGKEKEYIKIFKKLEKIELEQKNIHTIRSLFYQKNSTNDKLAKKYINQAIALGDTKSKIRLAKKYLASKDDELEKKGFLIYEELAQKEDEESIWFLANSYEKPAKEIKEFKDLEKAIFYYEKLFSIGENRGTRRLINIYFCADKCGKGNKTVYKKENLKNIINKFIEQKDGLALYSIAERYTTNYYIKRDIPKAIYYYKKAGEFGYDKAYLTIAMWYYKEKDYKNSMKYFKIASKKRINEANEWLGYFYHEGIGTKRDIDKALKYYAYGRPAHNMGLLYYEKKDYVNALKYFKLANIKDTPNTAEYLGIMYYKGLGTNKDINKALEYYKKAYNISSSKSASYNIALIYHYGKEGIKKDLNLAKKWYKRSGTIEAKKELKHLEK